MLGVARRSPRSLAVAAAVAAVLVVGGVLLLILRPGAVVAPIAAAAEPTPSRPATTPSPSPTPTPSVPAPATIPSPTPTPLIPGVADLTGMRVSDALAHRLPIAVLIDDNRIARPQSGFNGASIVYQAPADGGETRYMMVFQEGESRVVGPVRSGRSYFIHWLSESRAAVAHYGGDRVSRIYLAVNDGKLLTDIDALRTTGKPFHRISSRNAPHNAYTNTAALRTVIPALKGPALMPVELARRPFVDESALGARGGRQAITVPYRTGVIRYAYDRATNVYRRSVDGRTQVDPADRKPVTTRNVVVLFMSFRIDSKIEPGHARPVLGAIGTGKALVFREGRLVVGTWRKSSETALTKLYDPTGAELPLVRGRTFFQIVPDGTKVSPATVP
ncbi:MAG: DUF3048 domain-containing protein [Chloroflexi bacterium]|nr:DUF3048 domain-containing protein [Chloroflexota bacterium]